MGTLSLLSALICVQVTTATDRGNDPQPLYKHPTLVAMLQENNRLRASVGLAAQQISPELTNAAQDHANFMAETGNFSHQSNGGPVGRAARYGYSGALSENIAMGQSTIENAFHSWRNSSGHWQNIISNATVAGFGFAISADGSCYWVGMYGYSTPTDLE